MSHAPKATLLPTAPWSAAVLVSDAGAPLSFLCICRAQSLVLLPFGFDDKTNPSEAMAHPTHVAWVMVQVRPCPSEGTALWKPA